MSKGKNTIKFLLVCLFAVVFGMMISTASVFAEPDDTYAVESYVATEEYEDYYTEDETYSDYYTEDETEVYDDYEETTEYYTEASETADNTEETTETSSALTETTTQTEPEPTYRAPLPTVEDSVITPPTVVGAVKDREEPNLFWGFMSWILICVGVAVIFAVILSTKARAYRGGRDRYSNTDKISGKKKLLPQEYYDKRKRR